MNHLSRLFDMDTPIMNCLGTMTDIIYAGFLWVICSIPMITIGPASAALYYTLVKTVRHKRGTILASFWHSFRDNLKQGIELTILYGMLIAFIYIYVMQFQAGISRTGAVYVIAGIILITPVVSTLPYIFAIQSRFSDKCFTLMRYAFILSMRHLFSTSLLLIIMAVTAIIMIYIPYFIVIAPAVGMYLASLLMERIMKKYMTVAELNTGEELPWYLE